MSYLRMGKHHHSFHGYSVPFIIYMKFHFRFLSFFQSAHLSDGVVRVPLICMAYQFAFSIGVWAIERQGMDGVTARGHESMCIYGTMAYV